jgi:hypothetical protein
MNPVEYANPNEMFMINNLADEWRKETPIPRSWFKKNWKSRKYGGETYWWVGRYPSRKDVRFKKIIGFIRELQRTRKGLDMKYRVVKDGSYYLLYVNNLNFVITNVVGHPI